MKGFLLSFLFNLIFSAELLVLAVVAFFLHIFFGFHIAITYALLGLWILIALLITLGLGVLSKGTPSPSHQKNVNPYSKATSDFIGKYKNIDDRSDN